MRQKIALIGLVILAGCNSSSEVSPTAMGTQTASATPNPLERFDNETMPHARTPNYSEHEGNRYFYISEVSEDDKQKGVAVGRVSQYRYLGTADGIVSLEEVTENGSRISKIECKSDCRVLKLITGSFVSRMPYDPASIAGSAMQDAINGFLEPVKVPPPPTIATSIPATFFGIWQSRVSECGTGLDDSVVSVSANKLTFYESALEVKSVEVMNPTRAQVTGPLTDEEDNTQTKTYTLDLSGAKLTVDDEIRRSRCPAAK